MNRITITQFKKYFLNYLTQQYRAISLLTSKWILKNVREMIS